MTDMSDQDLAKKLVENINADPQFADVENLNTLFRELAANIPSPDQKLSAQKFTPFFEKIKAAIRPESYVKMALSLIKKYTLPSDQISLLAKGYHGKFLLPAKADSAGKGKATAKKQKRIVPEDDEEEAPKAVKHARVDGAGSWKSDVQFQEMYTEVQAKLRAYQMAVKKQEELDAKEEQYYNLHQAARKSSKDNAEITKQCLADYEAAKADFEAMKESA